MTLLIEAIFQFISQVTFSTKKTKFAKNIDVLQSEQWFVKLMEDARYEYIVLHNRNVVKYLSNIQNVEKLLQEEEEINRFIELVKEEHNHFVKVK
jgi:hypothetical protein